MRQNAWTLAVIGCTAAIVASVTIAGLASMSTVFAELERKEALRNATRARIVLEDRIGSFADGARDWSSRDAVLTDGVIGFSAGSWLDAPPDVRPDAPAGFAADVIVLARPNGTIISAYMAPGAAGTASDREMPVPVEFMRLASDSGASWATGEPAARRSGLLASNGQTYIVSVRPVLLSAGTTSADALLVAGRRLTAEDLARVSEQTDVHVSLQSFENTIPSGRGAVASIVSTATIVTLLDDDTLRTTAILNDVYGSPAALLTTTQDRSIRAESVAALHIFPAAVIGLGVVGGFICWLIARRLERAAVMRRESEAALRRSEARYRSLIDHLADPVLGFDAADTIAYANTQASVLTGYPHEQLVGMRLADLVAPASLLAAARMHSSGDTTHAVEIAIIRADGVTVLLEVAVAPLAPTVAGRNGTQWIARDITERKRFEEELLHLATRDPLTGLLNRRRFEDELAERLAQSQRTDEPGTILWLDLDSFKEVNDTLGHRAGDELLLQITRLIGDEVRAGSVMARLGGDEFAILFPHAHARDAAVAAERILNRLRSSRFAVGGKLVSATASIGIVQYPDHGATPEDLLARADLAMYRAKDAGRNRFCVFEPTGEWSNELASHFDRGLEIANALRDDRFTAHAQPIIDLSTGEIDRYELLIRMIDTDGELVMPGVFLPVAERSGMIVEIDRWMVRHAISLLSLAGPGVRVDVNLSGHAFGNLEILDIVQDELDLAAIDPSRLGFEITETAAVIDMTKARAFVDGVKRLGCRVALDDFGSGFSSFYYLRNIPIDCLKIDGTFIQHLAENPADQHVVRAIVELAAGFGIETTAEFVETAEVLDLLRAFGVRYAQGYYIGRPGPGTAAAPRSDTGPRLKDAPDAVSAP